jgi:hypothetical protein
VKARHRRQRQGAGAGAKTNCRMSVLLHGFPHFESAFYDFAPRRMRRIDAVFVALSKFDALAA